MAPGKELVGPLPTISFSGGVRYSERSPRVAYTVPRNTLDIRHAACREHHPACDCREAEHAEDFHEFRAERREAKKAFAEVLAGHQTWAYDRDGYRDTFAECKCTGCEIARRTHFRPSYHVALERLDARRAEREARGGDTPF